MLQTITIKRTEAKTLVLDVIQPLSKATLALVVNGQAQGIATPGPQAQISHNIGAWEVSKVSPECECAVTAARAKTGAKKARHALREVRP